MYREIQVQFTVRTDLFIDDPALLVVSIAFTMRLIRALVERVGDAFFCLGAASRAPEGALKLKEVSYDHAEGFPAGEVKHRPLALVSLQTPVLAVLTDDSNPEETLNNVNEVGSRGAPVQGCVSGAVEDAEMFVDEVFPAAKLEVMELLAANGTSSCSATAWRI